MPKSHWKMCFFAQPTLFFSIYFLNLGEYHVTWLHNEERVQRHFQWGLCADL